MCGGTIEVTEGQKVVTCEYCGATQTVHSFDNEKKTTFFKRAEALRFKCEFDKAAGVYETIVSEFPHEAEAYWGLVLCKYGIEYVDDPKTGKKIPTCHRTQFASVYEDADYMNVLKYADVVAKTVYEQEAKEISKLQKSILDISSKEDPFDIFICYKENDGKGNRTNDSVLAEDIHDELVNKGYRVFFSRITLEDKLGTQYEPYIFAALHSAKVMLHVTTSDENSESVWVRNEWSRFLSLIADGQKKTLIPCYKGISPYDLPEEMQNLQGQDMSKIGAMQDLLRGIDKILSRKASTKVETKTIVETRGPSGSYEGLVKKGHTYLKNNKFEEADRTFDEAIRIGEMPGEAYLGKVLAEYQFRSIKEVMESASEEVVDCDNYVLAKEFANDQFAKQLKEIEDRLRYNRLKENYDSAMAQYSRGDLESLSLATDNFRALEDFEDSPKMVKECIYKTGLVYLGMVTNIINLSYCENATQCFEEVVDFKNSREMITKVAETRNNIIESYKNSCLSKLVINYPKDVTNGSLKTLVDKVLLNRNTTKTFNPLYKDILEKQKEIEAEANKFIIEKSPALIDTFNQKNQCSNLRQICKSIEVNGCFKYIYELLKKKDDELNDIALAIAKKRRKKALKISAIVCASIAVIIASIFGIKAIVDENNRRTTLATAEKAMEAGNYEDALAYYESLGTYNGADKKAEICKGLIILDESIETGSEQDAIRGIKQIVKNGEPVKVNYSDSSGKVLKRKNVLKAEGTSDYSETITDVNFALYIPVENTGYTFSHWNSKDLFYKNNLTTLGLNSNWSLVSYKITYALDGGTNSSLNPTSYTIETPNITLENATKQNYQFLGWFDGNNQRITTIEKGTTGDISLKAHFELNRYNVRFVDWDGTELYSCQVWHGDDVAYPYSDPTRPATQQYTYSFAGWDLSLNNITSDLVITATYSSVINKYTVTFKNWNGTVLGYDTVDYGMPASYSETPTKPQTDDYSYYFREWDKDISCVTYDFETTALYDEVQRHTVVFKDYDGSTLWETKVDHGSTAAYNGGTNPSRPSTQQYSYEWVGWNESLENIISDSVFTPKFNPVINKYLATFKNWDGTVLQSSQIYYGEYAFYYGEDPAKQMTQQYSYAWTGWDKDPNTTAIIDDTVFTATFSDSVNQYSITFRNYNEAVLDVSTVDYGSDTSYNGLVPTKPTDYLKYTFSGSWTTSNGGSVVDDLKNVVDNRTVYAQYDTEGYKELVTSSCWNGVVGINNDNEYAVWGDNGYASNASLPKYLSSSSDTKIASPVRFDDFDKGEIQQVAVGHQFILVLTTEGDVYGRGRNDCGQLGDGTTINKTEFVKVDGPKFKYITANNVYSGGISTGGDIYVWGKNYGFFSDYTYAEITRPKYKVMNTVGSALPGYSDTTWNGIYLGAGFVVCRRESGDLWTFGCNTHGQIGDNTVSTSTVEEAQHPDINHVALGNSYGYVATKVVCGGGHIEVLLSNGKMYLWGDNYYGQCATTGTSGMFPEGSRTYVPSPVKLNYTLGINSDIVDIASGIHFSAALNDGGTVFIWGENASNVFGYENGAASSASPINMHHPEKIVKIFASANTLYALGESGILYANGSNTYGCCATGSLTPTSIASPTNKALFFN